MDSDTVLDAAKEPVESISMDSIEELEPPVISTKRTSTRKTRLVIKEEFEIDTSTEDNFKPESKIRLKSEQNPPSNLQSTGFLCSVCQTSFKTQKQYKLHLKIHRNYENLEIEKEKNTQFIDALNLNCKTCNKWVILDLIFIWYLNFKSIAEVSTTRCSSRCTWIRTTKILMFQRKETWKFLIVSSLRRESEFLSGKAVGILLTFLFTFRYACKFCGKEFVRAHEKVKHEMVHSGQWILFLKNS